MTIVYLSLGSQIRCKPAKPDDQDQIPFERLYITLLENSPYQKIVMAALTQDPRQLDLTTVPPGMQYIFSEGDTWSFSLGTSGLKVMVMLLGWTQNAWQEAILDVSIAPPEETWQVDFRARKGYSG